MKKQSQNKANLLDAQMNVSSVITKYYENERLCRRGENKPKQTQPVVSLSNLFQTRCTLCEFFLFFTFLCPSSVLTNQSISSLNTLSSFCRKGNYGKKVCANLDNGNCLPGWLS